MNSKNQNHSQENPDLSFPEIAKNSSHSLRNQHERTASNPPTPPSSRNDALSFASLNTESHETSHTPLTTIGDISEEQEEPNKRKRIIIALISILLVVLLIALGGFFWWRAKDEQQKRTVALATCQTAERTYNAAHRNLTTLIKDSENAANTPTDKVQNPQTLETLKDSLKKAEKNADHGDIPSCTAQTSSEDIAAITRTYNRAYNTATQQVKQLTGDVQAVNDSIQAKTVASLKADLDTAIREAQEELDNAAGIILNDDAREQLQTAINNAHALAGKATVTADEVNNAKSNLEQATKALQDSVTDALTPVAVPQAPVDQTPVDQTDQTSPAPAPAPVPAPATDADANANTNTTQPNNGTDNPNADAGTANN